MRYPLNFLPCFHFLLSVYGKGILLIFLLGKSEENVLKIHL